MQEALQSLFLILNMTVTLMIKDVYPVLWVLSLFFRLVKNSLCRSGWPQIHRDPSASASTVLELKVCRTTLNSFMAFPPFNKGRKWSVSKWSDLSITTQPAGSRIEAWVQDLPHHSPLTTKKISWTASIILLNPICKITAEPTSLKWLLLSLRS